LDTRENVWFAGVTSWSDTYGTRQRTTIASSRVIYGVWQYFVIEGDTTVYQAPGASVVAVVVQAGGSGGEWRGPVRRG
jgi:hypothetical protein